MKSIQALAMPLHVFFAALFFVSPLYASDSWPAVQDVDLRAQAGSALDFSGLFNRDPITEALSVSGGKFVRDGERQRFLCAPLALLRPSGGFPDHAKADALAAELRTRGYNLARMHHVDTMLLSGRTLPHDYDPEQLDRFHYLLAALKREGIRWMIDAASNRDSVHDGRGLNLTVHYDPASQTYWREQVNRMLNVYNPYTGTVILQDNALLAVTLFNELTLGFAARKGYPPELQERFLEWVLALEPKKTSKRIPDRWETSTRAAQMQRFLGMVEAETAAWMTAYLRELGYNGPVTTYNNGQNLQTAYGRGLTSLTTIHAYYDTPTDFIEPGSTMSQISSIEDVVPNPRYLVLNRYLDRPYIVDEYSHPYWSIWRREAGLVMPSYAALQDWDGICRFSDPVVLAYDKNGPQRERSISPFTVGMDPIARAGETLAALLFRRGDVSPALAQVPVYVDENFLFGNASGIAPMPQGYARAGLITGIGLLRTGTPWTAPISITPTASEAEDRSTAEQTLLWEHTLNRMKSAGMLKGSNTTDVATQIYESDTDEIKIEPALRQMRVQASRSEAVLFDQAPLPQLDYLKLESADTPALVSLSSLDDRTLKDSRHLLLIVATDAVNTGAQFSGDRSMLLKLGKLPVRLQPVKLRFFYQRPISTEKQYKLYALRLNGARAEQLPVEVHPTGLRINIDTAALTGGPTTYFELVQEDN